MKRIFSIFLILCAGLILATGCAPKGGAKDAPTVQAGAETKPVEQKPSVTATMPGDVKLIENEAELDDAKKRATAGDAAASASLALYYYNNGEPLDVDAAAINAKAATEAGVVEGKYVLAEILLYSRDEKAAETGLRMAQEASEAGYIPASAALGKYYFMGRVVPRDENQARVLFERGAEQNEPNALYCLGLLYATGASVTEDQAKAVDYFRKAADQGLGIAQFALATKYEKGEGVAKNLDEAVRLYQGPANAGNARAQVSLASILLENNKDPKAGVSWLRKASDQGVPLAQFFLAQCLLSGQGVSKNPVEAFKYCKQAAEAGLPIAQGLLGLLYFQGTGTTSDPAQAAEWFAQAAAWGDTIAMYHLAGMYFEGRGVKEDKQEAYYWAILAEVTEPIEETRAMRMGISQQISEQQRKGAERKAQDWKPRTMPI